MTLSHRQATEKQMSYLSSLAAEAGFTGHMDVNKALTGQAMYSGSRTYPSIAEASRMIDALRNGVLTPPAEVEESWDDLDAWDRAITDINYQASKGYMDDVLDTMTDLEDLARRLPSKSDEWTSLAIRYDYVA